MKLPAISLFSNCGAGDHGFHRAGFNFLVLAELEAKRLGVATLNSPGATPILGDLRTTWPEVVEQYWKRAGHERPALLAACPPCQGMSSAQSARGAGEDPDVGSRDSRNLLVAVVAEVAKATKPRSVVVENVPQFLTRKVRHPVTGRPIAAAKILVDELSPDYVCYPAIADMADFGVPQRRRRCFLTFIRRDEPNLASLLHRRLAPYPKALCTENQNGTISVVEALAGLPPLDASSKEQATSDHHPLHFVPVWGQHQYSMVAAIPPGTGASAWENSICLECGKHEASEKAITCEHCGALLPRPIVVPKQGSPRLVRGFRSSSYRRMSPDGPAPTITTGSGHIGSDRTIHPTENRVLSPLECARLQTFPDDFDWGDALQRWGHTNIRQMIGEAVPPEFTYQHGRRLAALLNGESLPPALSVFDTRVERSLKKLGLSVPGLPE